MKESTQNKKSRKYIIENNYLRKTQTQSDNEYIYEYEGNDMHNYRKLNNPKENINFIPNNKLRKTKTRINNNFTYVSNTSIEYFSEKEDAKHQRNMILNKGKNTFSTSIINNRRKNKFN